jgi:hypothetical protein
MGFEQKFISLDWGYEKWQIDELQLYRLGKDEKNMIELIFGLENEKQA